MENDLQWTAPFATRLDVDTLEDLVEGAGGFVTDRHVNFRGSCKVLFRSNSRQTFPLRRFICVLFTVPGS